MQLVGKLPDICCETLIFNEGIFHLLRTTKNRFANYFKAMKIYLGMQIDLSFKQKKLLIIALR